MSILIGCEESQTICGKFRQAGYAAYSCDLEPTRGNPDWHYQADIMEVIPINQWDLIILHPDCTAMAVSGNRYYGTGMPKHDIRLASIDWTMELWELAVNNSGKVALENPVSVIFPEIECQTQQLDFNIFYIQPWQFGHGETKKTGFATVGLPELKPTNIVDGRENRVWKMPPSPTRKRDRSKTFEGIADAIVTQWGPISLGYDPLLGLGYSDQQRELMK